MLAGPEDEMAETAETMSFAIAMKRATSHVYCETF
jgi:hypothetical protein